MTLSPPQPLWPCLLPSPCLGIFRRLDEKLELVTPQPTLVLSESQWRARPCSTLEDYQVFLRLPLTIGEHTAAEQCCPPYQ